MAPKMTSKWRLWRSGIGFLRFWEAFGGCRFLMSFGVEKKSSQNRINAALGRPKAIRVQILGRPGGMSGGAGGSIGGLEILVKLVNIELGKKFWEFGTGRFDKNYEPHLARTAPRLATGAADRLRAFRRAKVLGKMDCGFAALWFVNSLCFLASWGCGLTVFEKIH